MAPCLTALGALLGCGVLAVLCILHLTVRILGAAQGGPTDCINTLYISHVMPVPPRVRLDC